jgi:pimeloyl-[acyl-carrier protein] synthase
MTGAPRATPGAVDFDPRSPAFVADPAPAYHLLRREAPVLYVPATESWWLTRYDDVLLALQDRRLGKEPLAPGGRPVTPVAAVGGASLPPSMLFRDPPEHTRLRALVNRAFTPRVVEALRPHIQEVADRLLDGVAPQGRMDVMADFAVPLPAIVIAELLGVPPADRERFKAWSTDLALALDATQPPPARAAAAAAGEALARYFADLIAARQGQPRDDLISGLLAAEEQGDRLSRGELLSMCVLLLVAGHETTTNLIGGGTLALLRHPEQLHRLRRQPQLLPAAVEELLRYVSPVQRVGRIVREPLAIGGTPLPAGAIVAPVLAAANRDPGVFAEPDRLDLGRPDNRHLAFGRGIHFCLGAPLARLEGQIAFATLLARCPDLELVTPDPVWSSNTSLRSVTALPVRF